MAQAHYKAPLGKGLLGFVTEKDPGLDILESVARLMMLIEAEAKVGAEKGKHWGLDLEDREAGPGIRGPLPRGHPLS